MFVWQDDNNGPNMEDNVEQVCNDKTIMKTGQCGWQRWGHFVSPPHSMGSLLLLYLLPQPSSLSFVSLVRDVRDLLHSPHTTLSLNISS